MPELTTLRLRPLGRRTAAARQLRRLHAQLGLQPPVFAGRAVGHVVTGSGWQPAYRKSGARRLGDFPGSPLPRPEPSKRYTGVLYSPVDLPHAPC